MTVVYIDPLGTTTLLSTTTSLDDTVDDSDAKSTTMTGLTSSLTTALSNPNETHIYMANAYVDSLTDEQIVEMSNLLADKSIDLKAQDSNEKPKVYQKNRT